MSERGSLGLAAAVVLVALTTPPLPLLLLAVSVVAVAALRYRAPRLLLVVVPVLVVAGRADQQLSALAAPPPRQVGGVAELVDDPRQQRFAVSVLVRLQGRRYVARVPRELASVLRSAGTGDRVVLAARTSALRGAPEGWVRSRHLAGRLDVTRLERGPPTPVWFAAANAVRRLYRTGSGSFDAELRPLYLGMVIGDDRDLSTLREFRFRAAGLSHLTAVSGQNVAFLMALAAPVLTRLGARARLVFTLAVLVGLVLVTRADPSVLRASVMAGLGAVAMAAGRVATAVRILSMTVTALVVIDPMIVHALGFRLSVMATAGLVLLTGPIEQALPDLPLLPLLWRRSLAVALAAQLATLPLLLTLGPVSPVSVPANLLAVPAAGAVMMTGVVAGALAGVVVEPLAAVLLLPVRLLVAWVDGVARVATSVPVGEMEWGRATGLVLVGLVLASTRHLRIRTRLPVWPPWLKGTVGVVAVLALCWPTPPPPGLHELGRGVAVVVGGCGGVVVHLGGGVTGADTLEVLHRHDLHRIDVLVVGSGRAERSAAADVAEQWHVRRTIQLPVDTPTSARVGGASVVVAAAPPSVGLSGAACRLTR